MGSNDPVRNESMMKWEGEYRDFRTDSIYCLPVKLLTV